MPKIIPINRNLDRCSLDASHKCTRCNEQYDRPISDSFYVMCRAGASESIGYMFFCPGCKQAHPFHTVEFRSKLNPSQPANPVWTFNGNLDKPTFSPSLQVGKPGALDCCHLHLIDGVIQYCADGGTAHALKGQHVPLGEFKWHEGD